MRKAAVVMIGLLLISVESPLHAQVGEHHIKLANGLERHIKIDKDGAIHVPAFKLPPSDFLSPKARDAIVPNHIDPWPAGTSNCIYDYSDRSAIYSFRKCSDKLREKKSAKLRARYDVAIRHKKIGGVDTYIVTPADGIAPANKDRVLINIPGSGFIDNTHLQAQISAIPVAAVGKIKVVGVDYRKAPEYKHPSAVEDAMAVYRELLKAYRPENIGIYGASAGSAVVGQTVPWFQKEKLPLPGALGMFCGPAATASGGDSVVIIAALSGFLQELTAKSAPHLYWEGVNITDTKDPLVAPIFSAEVMKSYPPSLLMVSIRDFHLSQIVHTHAQLVKYDVEADLHVWDGLNHCEFLNMDIPEGQDANNIIVRFFDKYLGR